MPEISLSLSALSELPLSPLPSLILAGSRPLVLFPSRVNWSHREDESFPSSHPFVSRLPHPSRSRCPPGVTLPSPHPLEASDRKGAFTITRQLERVSSSLPPCKGVRPTSQILTLSRTEVCDFACPSYL